ncbi:hypothetical protein GCM10017566_61820 [Amycolatopsis bartoniae]|uniref:Uncharacterized protein n=1 Tax=Amycolatopsis bartoniae TaxID=941986 RepID=A0A8H9J5A3_9PSEU|nr:hypothetical protein GCM10017566_61820 [Amycolatopsis bartoniae]
MTAAAAPATEASARKRFLLEEFIASRFRPSEVPRSGKLPTRADRGKARGDIPYQHANHARDD